MLAKADIQPLEDMSTSRKLIFDTSMSGVQVVLMRGTDVPTYVRQGAVDMGVVGKDVLLEQGAAGMYEPLDLGIARCRLMTAAPVDWRPGSQRVRVATKFTGIARRFFAEQGVHANVIKLYGAMELAPIMNLADMIVDIVDTGNTLRANGMEPVDLIAEVSSRVVVNKAAMRSKHGAIQTVINALSKVVAAK